MSHRPLLVVAFVALGGLVPLRSAAQIVSPYGNSPVAYPNTTNNWADFTVYNVMGWTQTITLTCSASGSATSCSVASPIEVGPDETVFVGVSYSAGDVGAGSVQLTASGPGGSHQNAHDVTVQSPISVDFHRGSENQSVALCAVGCFGVRHVQSTVPYFSGNQPRSVSFVYDGDRAHARPFVYADVSLPYSPAVQKFSFRVKDVEDDDFLPFVSGSDATGTTIWYTGNAGHTVRVGGQIDARSDSTEARDIKVVVTFFYASGDPQEYVQDAVLILVNEANSPIAKGWTVAGVPRLYVRGDSSALMTGGDGSATFFRKCAGNCYTSPTGVASRLRTESGFLTLVSPDSTKIRFDTAGRAVLVTDRFADTITFGYDAQYRLITVSDPFYRINVGNEYFPYWIHRYTELVYDANGLSEIKELQPWTGGRVTKVSVGGTRTLDWIMDPDSLSTQFRYDDSVRLAAVINRRGDTTHFRYDEASWKLKRTRSPLVQIDTGSGPTAHDSVTVTLGPWQTIGIPTAPTSSSTPATAAEPSQVKGTVTDGGNHTTSFTVDRWGQPLVVTDAGNGVTSVVRDGINAVRVYHPQGGVDSLTWNGHQLTSMRPAGRSRINYRYGAYSQLDSVWGSGIAGQFYSLGTRGQANWVRVAGLIVANYFYDAKLRVDSIKDAGNHITRFRYNEYTGQLDSITYPGNRWSKRVFDSFGRDSVSRAASVAATTRLYDKVNRLVVQHVNADTTLLKYDPLFLIRVRDPKGQIFRIDVNALGWATREYDPADTASRYMSYLYDRDGRVKRWTNRRGDTVSHRFDALHRLVSRRGMNIVADSFWYSSDRRQVVGLNSVSRVERFMSPTGWVDSTRTYLNGTRWFRVRYKPTAQFDVDSIGISTSTSIAFARRQFFRNSSTTLLDSILVGSWVIKFQRNSERLKTSTTYPFGAVRTDAFTTMHQIHNSSFNVSALNLALWRAYNFDSLGRIQTYARKNGSTSAHLTHRYSYDGLGQVVGDSTSTLGCAAATADFGTYCGGSTWSLANSFDYDAAQNMDLWNTPSGNATFSYTDGNRRVDRAYDDDGNQTTRHASPDSLKWDAVGRLVRYRTFNGSKIVELDYDAFGQLVRKRVNGVVRRHFLWGGSQLVAELDSTADRRIGEYAYLPGVDRPVMLLTGATSIMALRYFEQDQAGNISGVFTSATVAEKTHYEPWGLPSTTSTTALADTNRLRWKGLFWDADMQLYYARARWYDPHTGRFLTEDPLGIAADLNFYTFAANDPINGRDPFGLDHCSDGPDPEQPPPSQPPLIAGLSLSVSCEEPPINAPNCPPRGCYWNDQGGGPKPPDAPADTVRFRGLGLCSIIGYGGCLSLGIYNLGDVSGFYITPLGGFGVDVSAGIEGGKAPENIFFGWAHEVCLSAGPFTGCRLTGTTPNSRGQGGYGAVGVSPQTLAGVPLHHVGRGYTFRIFERRSFSGCYGSALRTGTCR